MIIYSMFVDTYYFQTLGSTSDEDAKTLNCSYVQPKSWNWEPPILKIEGEGLKKGDFFQTSPDHLIVSARALSILHPFFGKAGEILPLFYQGESFALINILTCYHIVDYYRIERENSGRPAKLILKTNFRPEPGLFKVPGDSGVFALVNPETLSNNFFHAVRSHELEGLILQPVWSDSE
jgi:hypothetical protein